ncbi:hypothetical protein [Terrarubrum flagellatum]|uniref:hypothetical protein n=1 Tax=Terrirubrum flagellatum TaxID=2895980 RepID=UPI003144FC21
MRGQTAMLRIRPYSLALFKPKSADADQPKKVFGRSLSDFESYVHSDGQPLWPAERELLEACRKGEPAKPDDPRPEKRLDDNRLRAGFVRFLLLGGDDRAPVHERGVFVAGRFIEGDLDLEACTVDYIMQLKCCVLDRIVIEQATLKSVDLSGSSAKGVSGDGAHVRGDFFMSTGFVNHGRIRLLNARIDGDLDLQDAILDSQTRPGVDTQETEALIFDSAQIDGQLNLQNLSAQGAVRFNVAAIKGDADFADAKITGRRIEEIEKWGFNESHGPIAICAHQARIGGRLFLLKMAGCTGQIRLMHAKCAILVDDDSLIPRAGEPSTPDRLVLNGFIYDSLYPTSPVEAKTRIRWLELQPEKALKGDFRPQPWTQLASVLRGMGYEEAAKDISIEREKRQSQTLNWGAWLFHWLYGRLTSYGYRPQRIGVFVFIVWLVCAIIYHHAYRGDGIIPVDQSKISRFSPWAYSVDFILPVVSLGQSREWKPNVPSEWRDQNPPKPNADPPPKPRVARLWLGWIDSGVVARWTTWIETVLGWIGGFSLVAFLSGLAKRDK